MHILLLIQLPHPRIHPRDPGRPLTPLLPPLIVVLPLDEVELDILRHVHAAVRHVDHHMAVELAESDFADPAVDADVPGVEVRAAVPLFRFLQDFPHGDDAGSEVRAEAGGVVRAGRGALFGVLFDFLVEEVGEAVHAGVVARGPEFADAGLLVLRGELFALRERGDGGVEEGFEVFCGGFVVAFGCRDGVEPAKIALRLLQPGFVVRCEDFDGPAVAALQEPGRHGRLVVQNFEA